MLVFFNRQLLRIVKKEHLGLSIRRHHHKGVVSNVFLNLRQLWMIPQIFNNRIWIQMKGKMEYKRKSLNKKLRKQQFVQDQGLIHDLVQNHQENKDPGHNLVLESVSTESDHAPTQEKERGSHTQVKGEPEKGRKNGRKRGYLQLGLKH